MSEALDLPRPPVSDMQRLVVLIFVLLLSAAPATGQQSRIRTIGFIVGGYPTSPQYTPFVEGLKELGYTEGRDFQIEWRYARGKLDMASTFARELVDLNVDIIVTAWTGATRAAKAATTTIPIVMGYGTDPVGYGLVSSLSRPGENITGLASMLDETVPKQFDIIAEL